MSQGDDELIDSHVSLHQCTKAVEALHAHESKRQAKLAEDQLLPGKEQNVWLNVTVKKIPARSKFKPHKIPIVHPLVDPRVTSVCLITKDPQREYKDLLEKHTIKFISRVVGVEKLKGKFKPFEARRMLLKENGLFLADERIIPLLPKLLGAKWFEAKKQPVPVCLSRKDLKGELERAISSTYMSQNQGTCTSIKVSLLSHTPSQIVANIRAALPAVAKAIFGGWENVQSIHIKTNESVSLPIWACALDGTVEGRWAGLQATTDVGEKEEEEGNKKTEKGKRRTRGDEAKEIDEREKPKKKLKKSAEAVPDVADAPTPSEPPAKTSPKAKSGTSVAKRAADAPCSAPSKEEAPSVPPVSVSDSAARGKKKKKKTVSTDVTIEGPSAASVGDVKKDAEAALTPTTILPPPAAESLTPKELKRKRTSAGDKKKEKVVEGKRKKGAKDKVLGKKAAQE